MKLNMRMVGEFVLIVVGVLVALTVETALENRKDDQLRDEYLVRLRQDIELDKLAIERRIEFFADVKRFAGDALSWLDSDKPVDKVSLLASFYASEVWPLELVRNTYEDLRNTGNIRLLDDIDLRTGLSGYYNKANISDMSSTGWNPTTDYRQTIRGIIPGDVQALIRKNCPTTLDLDQAPSGFPPCELPGIDYSKISLLFAPLRSDVEFHRMLTYRDSELAVILYLLGQQRDYAAEVLELLPPAP